MEIVMSNFNTSPAATLSHESYKDFIRLQAKRNVHTEDLKNQVL